MRARRFGECVCPGDRGSKVFVDRKLDRVARSRAAGAIIGPVNGFRCSLIRPFVAFGMSKPFPLVPPPPESMIRLPGSSGCCSSNLGPATRCLALMTWMLVFASACSKEEMQQALDDAKAKTQEISAGAVAKVEEVLPETGRVALQFNGTQLPESKRATIEVIQIGDGRPGVVQIRTDAGATSPTFPVILLQGRSGAASVADLAGQSVDCDVMIRPSYDQSWMTPPGSVCRVTFSTFDPEQKAITATLSTGQLIATDGKTVQMTGGDVIAVEVDA